MDNLRVQHAKIVRAWAARHRKEIKIFYLPAYSPELNPDELVNSDLKIGIGQREPSGDKKALERQICEHMDGVKANPKKFVLVNKFLDISGISNSMRPI